MQRFPSAAGMTAVALALALPLYGASTGQTQLHMPQGNTAGTANGDFVTATTASGGIGGSYHYFIEVPAGLTQLVVEVFDADVGRGGNADETGLRDRSRAGTYSTSATYTLIRPDGSTAATLNCSATACNDAAWNTVLSSGTAQNTAAGHWELRVTMGAGTDINGIGIRANDGTAGSGGTELNVYIDSIVSFGIHPPDTGTASQSYTVYPYITSGCSASENDFDYDSNSGTVGSLKFTSRGGAFTKTFASASLSTNDNWKQSTFNGWTSDQSSGDYGIWTLNTTITSYLVNGTPNGNYTDVYIGSYQAATTDPTANPVPNSFRIYIANDAGNAPSKPFVDQTLTFGGCGGGNNGPNPPAVGQTSCYTVTARVVNPTAKAITFSAAHLVTADVPGGGAVYNGNAQVSQGSVTAQPAVGGTGNITWNPGTVAAGATALLSYRVKVTPTAAGQRIPVTATPASGNGTRAQYVDETGNTTQARATYLFGPLCELATTVSVITEAVVTGLHARHADGGGVEVEWRTASEAATAGFYLDRWDGAAGRWARVSDTLLAALQSAPQGGTYRFLDESAAPAGKQIYRLEEVEAGGGRRLHGPFAVMVDWSRDERSVGTGLSARAAAPASRRAVPDLSGRTAAARAWSPAGVHLTVRQTGLYSLRSSDIADWFGLSQRAAESLLGAGKLALSRDGRPVAWQPDWSDQQHKRAQGLLFYGEASPGVYATGSVYRLRRGAGLLMEARAAAPSPGAADGTFPAVRHLEQDVFAATVLDLDPESDYWFWEFLQGGDATYGHRTFAADAPGVAAAAPSTLTVALQGATASGTAGEHHVLVSLNGTPLGETAWQGIAAQSATFAVPAGLLHESGNQVEVTAEVGDGAPYSIVYVNSFDLGYRRALHAVGDTLAFALDGLGGSRAGVAGFSSSSVRLLDVRDARHPLWLTGAAVEPDLTAGPTSYRVGFIPEAGARYLAAAPAAFLTSAAVRPWSAPALRESANRTDYLVVAPAAWRAAAERLADLRRGRGLAAKVVSLEQIADEFAAGAPGPHALQAFLAYAWQSWSRAPRYVVLAGAGTLDYRNLLGFGDCIVPPLLVRSPGGLFPSDNALADVDGDGMPEMAVGRIPVLSAAGLDAATSKLAASENGGAADWARHVVLLSDDDSGETDFSAASDGVASQLAAGFMTDAIALRSTPLDAARGQLFADLGQGASLVNYMGHGGVDRMSAGGLLTSGDVAALTNGDRLPVVTAMTCMINRFAVPGIPSLGEVLVQSPTGGAAAVWGPSGLADNAASRRLAECFYRTTSDPADPPLGDRILHAMSEFRALGGDGSLLQIYNLLGDPALRLRHAPEPPATGGTGGE